MSQCIFQKPDGIQCGANAVTNDTYCFSHSELYREQKILATTKGGLARKHYQKYGEELSIKNITDIQNLIALIINGVWTGNIPANEPANSLAYLARCWIDAYDKSELESRIKTIEEFMNKPR